MSSRNFIKSESDLIQSVVNYNNSPEFIRSSLGGYPKYFVHTVIEGKHYFGLSKFCAFNEIKLLDYISGVRHDTNGGTTQKYIPRVCKKEWIPYHQVSPTIRKQFNLWIGEFFPTYTKSQSNFISVKAGLNNYSKNKDFKFNDQQRKLIGEKGEKIALRYEEERVGAKGKVDHISLRTDRAGYDIYSKMGKEERFIEVKASQGEMNEFYITSNEIETLKKLKDSAYLYLVKIIDLKKEIGAVEEIKNPWNTVLEKGTLKPVSFRFKFK